MDLTKQTKALEQLAKEETTRLLSEKKDNEIVLQVPAKFSIDKKGHLNGMTFKDIDYYKKINTNFDYCPYCKERVHGFATPFVTLEDGTKAHVDCYFKNNNTNNA